MPSAVPDGGAPPGRLREGGASSRMTRRADGALPAPHVETKARAKPDVSRTEAPRRTPQHTRRAGRSVPPASATLLTQLRQPAPWGGRLARGRADGAAGTVSAMPAGWEQVALPDLAKASRYLFPLRERAVLPPASTVPN